MAFGGVTFLAAKDRLRLVVENGVAITDPRIMPRTNEAMEEILSATDPYTKGPLIPVGSMLEADVVSTDEGMLYLPNEFANVISYEVKPPGTISRDADVKQGWYDITNPFTYIDPSAAHDNPLIDHGLVPYDDDPSRLRRKMQYFGISPGAIVTCTGKRRYVPITSDGDYLIVQNVQAVKMMIQVIEMRENRAPRDDWKALKEEAITMLAEECRTYLMDPMNFARRKGWYEDDLTKYAQGSFGWVRARIALEVPGAQKQGKSELTRILERSEMRLMEMGMWKGCIQEFDATIVSGHILFPAQVETALSADICGNPAPIRSIFFKYLENGPGDTDCTCGGRLQDEGEEYFPGAQNRRRKYKALIGSNGQKLTAVCKLRWVKKAPEDQMTIRNLEAHRIMVGAILMEQAEKWPEANAAMMTAKKVLDDELKEYLSGIRHTIPISPDGIGLGDIGSFML